MAVYDPNMASPESWSSKAQAFSHLTFGVARDPGTPYAFDMQSPIHERYQTVRSVDSGTAVMGYQLDPFNIPKERPIQLAPSEEPAAQPSPWRSFGDQGNRYPRMKHQQHSYSTSIEQHRQPAYAY
jgi:hypothetical protein